jgi:hypothetical protein
MEALLVPPAAFLIYVALIYGVSRILAGPVRRSPLYAGGEVHPKGNMLLGYRRYLIFALFFAVVHIGVLILASGPPSATQLVYLGGIILSLITLLLG